MLITKEQIIGNNAMTKQDKINLFESLLMSVNRPGIDKVIDYIRRTDFYSAPASTRYHSNYEGGLLDHALMVYALAEQYLTAMKNVDPTIGASISDESVIIVSLLHDICKTCMYKKVVKWKKNEFNEWMQYDGFEIEDTFPIGHGEKSVIMLQNVGLELNACEMLAIRYHMGFWGEQNADLKAAQIVATKMCPLIALIQQADYGASVNFEVEIKH